MAGRPVAGMLAACLLLAGCGGTLAATSDAASGVTETAAPLAGTFNDTDVMFLQMAIPQHEQGIELAALAADRAGNADVRDLAAAVEATQTDELADMKSWLRDWDQPVSADPDPHAHAGHGGMHTTDPEVLATLRRTPAGPDFDRTFVNLFTGHQHGAVELARMEMRAGKYPGATALADRIIDSRTAEIRRLARLVAGR
jgi:uncharacterized protein (DUF305 family)